MSSDDQAGWAERLQTGCAAVFDEAVVALQDLVRIPSFAGTEGEAQAQRFMADLLQGLGLTLDMWEVNLSDIKDLPGFSPAHGEWKGKLCVVGTHKVEVNKGKTLILNGHVDIVPTGPPELWTSGPFDPQIRDGRLYGRGSGDMKAGVIAMCYALKVLQHLKLRPTSTIHVQTVIDEECTGNGTLAVCNKGYKADCAIIPEPFHCVMTAQLGVMWFDVVVTGRPAHVLDTSMGSNAIESSFKVFQALKGLEEKWNAERHPLYKDHKKPINFNLGKIDGGEWGSTVPSKCRITVRIGYYPGIPLAEIRKEVETCIEETSKQLNITSAIEYHGFQAEGCTIDLEADNIRVISEAHTEITGKEVEKTPLTCTTDVRYFQLYYGIPATVYGPKYTKNIHSIDESVCLESFKETIVVLALFIIKWCGVEAIE